MGEKLLIMFEEFVKRALVPSLTFYPVIVFMVLLSGFTNIVLVAKPIIESLNLLISTIKFSEEIIYFILGITLIATANIFVMISYAMYDLLLKWNFNFLWRFNNDLTILRKEVINKLKEEKVMYNDTLLNNNVKDAILYQILGKFISSNARYVNEVRTYSMISISFMLSFPLMFMIENVNDGFPWFQLVIVEFIIFIVSLEVIRSKYRSRNIRMYINYLQS